MGLLDRKLTEDEQRELLELCDLEKHDGVIYYAGGDEFYGCAKNDGVELDTLKGIIDYLTAQAEKKGRSDKAYEIRLAIGV